jgi:ferric-dicitrate binding protein FerR (iron transport regulator)
MNVDDRSDDVERLIKLAGPRPAVPEDIAARVKANVHGAWTDELRAQRTRRRFLFAAPLAAAAILALVLWLRPARVGSPAPRVLEQVATVERVVGNLHLAQKVHAGDVISTGDARVALRMSDGASLRLDSDTRVSIKGLHSFDLDSGRLYIDTVQSGVTVRTKFGTVRDIGTKFEVSVSFTSARVRVRDGEIALGEHHAHRGEQLDVTQASSTVSRIETWGEEWRWLNEVAPPFIVDGKNVSEFMTWFASESGMEVRYDSQATATKANDAVLHGSVGTLGPIPAANAVLPTAGLRGEVKDGVLTVRAQ